MENHLKRCDLHVHSNKSYDVADLETLSPRALFERAMNHADPERRMDFFVLTDHDTMDGYLALQRELPEADRRLVIPAVEHTLRDPGIGFTLHVNLFGIDPDVYHDEVLDRVVTLDDLLEVCRRHGVRPQYNHPIWWEPHEVRAGTIEYDRVPAIAEKFDVLELNAGRSVGMNLVAAGIARQKGKSLTSNSDSHTGDVGRACTLAAGETWDEFLGNVWAGESRQRVASLTRTSLHDMASMMIDAVLDADESVSLGKKVTRVQSRMLEKSMQAVLQSKFVRDFTPARESLRHVLRRVSHRVIARWLDYEKGLEHHVMSGELGSYLLLNAALGPKGPAENGDAGDGNVVDFGLLGDDVSGLDDAPRRARAS